ncbi:hypothetical protein [Streptosporangium sp. NPDC023615]|uniref:hypothetical protein n=1 Tax=Streptosporangium sp. NPDC023615 TaxID=3154794 RepID=UPI00342256E0
MKNVAKKAMTTAGAAAIAVLAVLGPSSPAAAGAYKYLETAHAACPYWATGTYDDSYASTGYRAFANECHTKPYVMSARVRLVTSCSWGFTYRSETKTIVEGRRASFTSPSKNEPGCLFGVSDYWLEEV